MYAVIKSGGRQYQVSVGETLQVNRLPVEVGDQVRFEEVLLISDAGNVMVGTPMVSNALVLATATEQGRGEKLIVFKYKPKKRYRHRRGHRQELTFLTIDDIVSDGKSLVTGEAPEFREKGASPVEDEGTEEAAVVAEDTASSAAEASAENATEPAPEKKTRRRRTAKTEDSEAQASETEE